MASGVTLLQKLASLATAMYYQVHLLARHVMQGQAAHVSAVMEVLSSMEVSV